MATWCLGAMRSAAAAIAIGAMALPSASAQTGQPIRIGLSLALTGAGAAPSKVINTALEMWRDDVNAKGGMLGRPVELVVYDDQSTPANVPAIYTKLITLDKVDLLLGPYGTNFVAPAMPAIMPHNKMTISFTAIGINDKFKYDKYFSMVSVGPDGINAFSRGFFEIAVDQNGHLALRIDPQHLGMLWLIRCFERHHNQFELKTLLAHGNLGLGAKHAERTREQAQRCGIHLSFLVPDGPRLSETSTDCDPVLVSSASA